MPHPLVRNFYQQTLRMVAEEVEAFILALKVQDLLPNKFKGYATIDEYKGIQNFAVLLPVQTEFEIALESRRGEYTDFIQYTQRATVAINYEQEIVDEESYYFANRTEMVPIDFIICSPKQKPNDLTPFQISYKGRQDSEAEFREIILDQFEDKLFAALKAVNGFRHKRLSLNYRLGVADFYDHVKLAQAVNLIRERENRPQVQIPDIIMQTAELARHVDNIER